MFKKWTVFLTYGWIEEAVTWEDTCSSLKQNQCFFYWNGFVQKFDWFLISNVFVFTLKIFTRYLQQPQFCVTFVHLDKDSLILQRTNNTRQTQYIIFKLKNWIFSRKLVIFDIFIFIVVYFFVAHIADQRLII